MACTLLDVCHLLFQDLRFQDLAFLVLPSASVLFFSPHLHFLSAYIVLAEPLYEAVIQNQAQTLLELFRPLRGYDDDGDSLSTSIATDNTPPSFGFLSISMVEIGRRSAERIRVIFQHWSDDILLHGWVLK
jgi:hypothetical protein